MNSYLAEGPWWTWNFASGHYWWVAEGAHPMPCSFIYGLVDASGAIRYVGMASNPVARLSQHQGRGRGCGTFSWARGMPWELDIPRMVIIEVCDHFRARERERFWIETLDKKTPGGLMNNDLPGERRSKTRYLCPPAPPVYCFNCGKQIGGRGGVGGCHRQDIDKWACLRSRCFKAGEAIARTMRVGIYS